MDYDGCLWDEELGVLDDVLPKENRTNDEYVMS